jgi:hypothetical protein
MTFANLFTVEPTGNRIDLLTHAGRESITHKTVAWWQSQGWEVHLYDNTGYPPAVGRNRIIRDYKSSDREVLIMADDDITLYTHRYLTLEWLKKPLVRDVYTLNSNHKMNILKQYSRDWDHGNHHWTVSDCIGQLYVIGNKNIPLQDENLNVLEDFEWAWQCFQQGITCRMLHTVFLREQSQDRGSLIATDRGIRKQMYAKAEEYILKKYNITKKAEFRKQYIKKET